MPISNTDNEVLNDEEAPVTPAPVTPAPVTPAPVTPAPVAKVSASNNAEAERRRKRNLGF